MDNMKIRLSECVQNWYLFLSVSIQGLTSLNMSQIKNECT